MDTRNALLDAAEDAVRTSGHDGFSYADLSDRIGIRKASIHYHFPTKGDLLTAIMKRYREAMMDKLARTDQTCETAAQKLAAYLRIYRDALYDGSRLCLCVAFSSGQESLASGTRAEINRFRAQVSQWLVTTMNEARHDGSVDSPGDPEEEGAALFALAEGAQLGARYAGDITRFDRSVAMMRRRLTSRSPGRI